MSKRSELSIFGALGVAQGFSPGRLVRMAMLGAVLSLATTTGSFAQSYDPDIGSGNIRGGGYGRSYFRGFRPAWRAMVVPHRWRHVRRHRHW